MVQACFYQEHGIGRPMKVGKEGVAGAIAALEAWMTDDRDQALQALNARLLARRITVEANRRSCRIETRHAAQA